MLYGGFIDSVFSRNVINSLISSIIVLFSTLIILDTTRKDSSLRKNLLIIFFHLYNAKFYMSAFVKVPVYNIAFLEPEADSFLLWDGYEQSTVCFLNYQFIT